MSSTLLEMGIGVLSIVFSIFFAALAFIISASDDDFVKFIEEEGYFTSIIDTFKWTVWSLFFALLYGIILYIVITFYNENNPPVGSSKIHESAIAIYCFLFFYSLVATLQSTNDAITYSKARVKYIRKRDQMNKLK